MIQKRALLPLLTCAFIALSILLAEPLRAESSSATEPVALAPSNAPTIAPKGSGRTENSAQEAPLPNQYGMSAEYDYAYDPSQNLSFMMARIFAIYDYGTFWHQNHSKSMRFKVEGALGSTVTPTSNLMASANMLALFYYPGMYTDPFIRPYFEAGIGVIYTEFRVKGQGLHFNFNPVLGLGLELPQKNGKNFIVAVRLYHLSNAGIDDQNRGVNSVGLQIGRFF